MAVTLAMIADQVGIDRSLVSRVLRGDPGARLSEAKREQIIAVAKASGYRPNRLGRSLRTGRTSIIGVLTPDVTNPFHSVLFRGVEAAATAAGYDTILCNTDDREDRFKEVVSVLSEGHVDGLLVATAHSSDPAIDWLAEVDLPYILVNRRRQGAADPWIGPDDFQTGYLAGKTLLELDHKRIAMLTATFNLDNVRLRVEGFKAAVNDHGDAAVSCTIIEDLATRAEARDCLEALLRKPRQERPTAVFAGQTQPAEGAIHAIYRRRLRIPEDVSIIGYSASNDPEITSIYAPVYEMGQLAAERLVEHLAGQHATGMLDVNMTLPIKMIDRGTTAPPHR